MKSQIILKINPFIVFIPKKEMKLSYFNECKNININFLCFTLNAKLHKRNNKTWRK